jgi:hypothetical protein
MTISFRQATMPAQANTVTSLNLGPFGLHLTAGNGLTIEFWLEGASGSTTVSGITDNAGQTWVFDGASTAANGLDRCELWRVPSCSSFAGFLTATVSVSGSSYVGGLMQEWNATGGLSLNGTGGTNHGVHNTAQPSTGAFSSTIANTLILVSYASGGASSVTIPAGFTNLGSNLTNTGEDGNASYEIVTSIQTGINPTWSGTPSSTAQWAAIGQAYQEGAGPAGRIFSPSPLSGLGGGGSLFTDPLAR